MTGHYFINCFIEKNAGGKCCYKTERSHCRGIKAPVPAVVQDIPAVLQEVGKRILRGDHPALHGQVCSGTKGPVPGG